MKACSVLKDAVSNTYVVTKLIKKLPKKHAKLQIILGKSIIKSGNNHEEDDKHDDILNIQPSSCSVILAGQCVLSVLGVSLKIPKVERSFGIGGHKIALVKFFYYLDNLIQILQV